MAHYLLLCLIAIYGIKMGDCQVTRQCNYCNIKINDQCITTNSIAVCPNEDDQCGIMKFSADGNQVFNRYGCFMISECNKTAQVSGVLRAFTYTSTCCPFNFCNGGLALHAPHFIFLGAISTFTLYIKS
ncbi:hypothetical protein XELAEV_18039207mg [Xenopus laevis]|uniref:UPAR/Ly6 domain-containing protein n=1 Tax=Xenopus laevis TaxID=8355 RepID=A0A974H7M9_XENLA|nr:hypothetical protein XELAEV_18039207mg [Xenopus laevis]